MQSPFPLTRHQFKQTLLASSIALALSACGGGSSITSSEGSGSFSGTVADGYLKDARVCLDLNENKVCDEGEPSAISTAGGQFTLDGVSQSDIDTYSLVVEIIEGLTEDEDEPGVPIDKTYTMTAPAGYSFVSPLTTMVKQELDDNRDNENFSVDDAEANVKTKLGTNLDLKEDYVKAKGEDSSFSEDEKEEFEKLHKVAQVTARVLKENIDDVKTAVDGSDVTFDQVLDLVVGQVLEALETINEQVEDSIEDGDDWDPDAMAENEDITTETGIDTDKAEEEIAARQAEKQASAANLIELVSGVGINWFDAHDHDGELRLNYGSFQHNTTTGTSSDEEFYYDPELENFVRDDERDNRDYLLTEEGWTLTSDEETITINEDGSISITNAEVPGYAERLEARQFDVAGLNIASTLAQSREGSMWAEVLDPLAEFSQGGLGFKLTFTSLNNQYRMWNWDCDESEVVGGMCNWVWTNNGDGDWENDGAAESLSDLISQQASDGSDPNRIKGPQVAWFGDGSVFAEMLAGGQVNYYRVLYLSNGETEVDLVAEGDWDDHQIGEVSVIVMELPTNILKDGDFSYDERFILFTELNGYVRRGEFTPAGDVDHGEVVFNVSAKEDIIAAFRGERFDALAEALAAREEERDSEDEEEGGEEGPAPLTTTLQACETGDSEDSLSGGPELFAMSDFDTAVSSCGGAMAINADYIVGKRFAIAEAPNENIEFFQNGMAVFTEVLPSGETEVEDMAWDIVEGQLIVSISDQEGLIEKDTISMLQAQEGELSLKGFFEEREVYEGADFDGSQGEIWSSILVDITDQSSAIF